ncbi:uncharacterized protein [Amphiura filiformis]|uniref:uncharacterized protein n=1 Tax=Amphiura filiformis TaxID=82378 RepID=UPI003B219E1E
MVSLQIKMIKNVLYIIVLILFTRCGSLFGGTTCSSGWPIINRDSFDSYFFTMVAPGKPFSCHGKVTSWRYVGRSSSPFRAMVWRPVPGFDTYFTVVGVNDIPEGDVDVPVTYEVPYWLQITVLPGDVIGWSFEDSVLPYTPGGDDLVRWSFGYFSDTPEANQIHQFDHNAAEHREYSIEATVSVDTGDSFPAIPAYIGCFSDNIPDERGLPIDGGYSGYGMTLQMCQDSCSNYGTDMYAGLQNGVQCYCGDISAVFYKRTQQSDSLCQTTCSGDDNDQYCGNYGYSAVYDLGRPNTLIRLVGSYASYKGRVELFYNNTWSTVCSDGWDMSSTRVACRMAGFQGAETFDTDASTFGHGTGDIIMNNVACSGEEDSLYACEHSGLFKHVCNHGYDVGVVCYRWGGVRLTGGYAENEGRVEISYDGIWRAICHDSWDIENRHVVCRQLGYGGVSGGLMTDEENLDFGPGPASYGLYGFECGGTETDLSDCFVGSLHVTHECSEKESVICEPLTENGVLRLMDGDTLYEGRVEVYYEGSWGAVCDDEWSDKDAEVVCRQLGYGSVVAAYSNAYFGSSTGHFWLDDLGCEGTESALESCVHIGWGNNNCAPSEAAGVQCSGEIDKHDSSGLSGGEISGIGFGVLAFLFLLYIFDKQKKLKERENRDVGLIETCQVVCCDRKLSEQTEEQAVNHNTASTQQVVNHNPTYQSTEPESEDQNVIGYPKATTRPQYFDYDTNGLHGFPSSQVRGSNLPPLYPTDIYNSTTDLSDLPPPPSYEVAAFTSNYDLPNTGPNIFNARRLPSHNSLPEINN